MPLETEPHNEHTNKYTHGLHFLLWTVYTCVLLWFGNRLLFDGNEGGQVIENILSSWELIYNYK